MRSTFNFLYRPPEFSYGQLFTFNKISFYFLYGQVDFFNGQIHFLNGQVDFLYGQIFTFYMVK